MAVAPDRGLVDAKIRLRRATAEDRAAAGPWLLAGAARHGESIWFTLADGEEGHPATVIVLVRREGTRAADLGYAPAGATPSAELLVAALRLVARHAFDELALERLETHVRGGDSVPGEALATAGFTCVGYDRHDRPVWSLVPRDLR